MTISAASSIYRGGGRFFRVAAGAGLAGLILCIVGMLVAPKQAFSSYLVAFSYWLGLGLGALAWLLAFHASHAQWSVVLRRLLEILATTVAAGAVLFVPLAVGVRQIYPWASPHAPVSALHAQIALHNRPYLNGVFFVLRAACYFACWIVISELLLRWSRQQDAGRKGRGLLTIKQRRLGAGSLPLFGLTLTFAAVDWLMSLSPTFSSTIFGLYYFAGLFAGAMSLLIVVTFAAERAGLLRGLVAPAHYYNMGKYLLAFVCFWAYIAFAQFMLVWIGNLPEEVPWYLVRTRGPWTKVAVLVVLGHFVVPFALLLSKDRKLRPTSMLAIAIWMLVFHYLDTYWMVMPRLHPETAVPHWLDLCSWVGVGGALAAFAMFRLRNGHVVPVGDPFIAPSIAYHAKGP